MRKKLPGLLAAGLRLVAASGAAGCSGDAVACGGQCGPPFQMQVIFRPGTGPGPALAALQRCQGEAVVVRIGRVRPFRRRGEPHGPLSACVFTRSMRGSRAARLQDCLRASPVITQAGFGD